MKKNLTVYLFTGRVDELEQEASSLKSTLTSADRKIAEKEKKWQEKLDNLEDELACNSITQEETKLQHSLKIEVEGLKNQNNELQKVLDDKISEAEKSETAFRSEVSLPISSGSSTSSKHKLGLVRYRSLRDHNGRYYLVVKIH